MTVRDPAERCDDEARMGEADHAAPRDAPLRCISMCRAAGAGGAAAEAG